MNEFHVYASYDGEIFISCNRAGCNWSKEMGSHPSVSDLVFAKVEHLKECGR